MQELLFCSVQRQDKVFGRSFGTISAKTKFLAAHSEQSAPRQSFWSSFFQKARRVQRQSLWPHSAECGISLPLILGRRGLGGSPLFSKGQLSPFKIISAQRISLYKHKPQNARFTARFRPYHRDIPHTNPHQSRCLSRHRTASRPERVQASGRVHPSARAAQPEARALHHRSA